MKAMHGPDLKFFVTSEDKTWLDEQPFLKGMVRSPFDNPAIDMAVLASCKHLITTIGTFGWWSGYFNEGTVLYKPQPLRPSMQKDEDFFLPHWIPVSDEVPFFFNVF